MTAPAAIEGRAWMFGDDVDTDQMMPTAVLFSDPARQAAACLSGLRPGWSAAVRDGDILVAGRNFGLGSSRPAPIPLRHLGLACVLAESLATLFFRNCISHGLLALECPGIAAAAVEGARLRIDLAGWRVHGPGGAVPITPVPAPLLALMTGGGILPMLERQGCLSLPEA